MAIRRTPRRELSQAAIDCILQYIEEKRQRGDRVVTLTELEIETRVDPVTVEEVMNTLVNRDILGCRRMGKGEMRWYFDR